MEKSQRQQNPPSQTSRRSRSRGVRTKSDLLNIALRMLQVRPRSTLEITTRLNKYTQDRELLDQIIDQLKTLRFLDDAKFSQWLIESRSRTRPRGKRLLIQELKSKGIDVTNHESLITDVDEIALASQALQKKAKSWANLSSKSYQLKAKSYLYARGFPWGVIESVLKKVYNPDNVS